MWEEYYSVLRQLRARGQGFQGFVWFTYLQFLWDDDLNKSRAGARTAVLTDPDGNKFTIETFKK